MFKAVLIGQWDNLCNPELKLAEKKLKSRESIC